MYAGVFGPYECTHMSVHPLSLSPSLLSLSLYLSHTSISHIYVPCLASLSFSLSRTLLSLSLFRSLFSYNIYSLCLFLSIFTWIYLYILYLYILYLYILYLYILYLYVYIVNTCIYIYIHIHIFIYSPYTSISFLFLSLSLPSLSLSLYIYTDVGDVSRVCVCVCVCVVWGQTHRLDREKHTHTRTGYILKYSQNISKIISEEWYSLWTPGIIESSIPNKLIASLLLVHPSASNRGPMSMMPRFSENERERAIIGIIECTVNLVGEAFVLVRFSFFFFCITSFPSVKTPWELGTYRGPDNFLERAHAFASAKKQSFFRK